MTTSHHNETTLRNQLERDIEQLLETRSPHCLSIYHDSSDHRTTVAEHQIVLKNLIQEAKNKLPQDEKQAAHSREIIDRLTADLPRLAEAARASTGLCVLCTQRQQYTYPLPFAVPQKVMAGPGFYLRPLVTSLSKEHRFYVLALSQNDARLIHVDDEIAEQVPFRGSVPQSLDEATPTLRESQLQFHSGGTGATGGVPAFHGQQPGERRKDEDLKRFLSQVTDEVSRIMDSTDTPLVLCGVEELTAKFRKISDCNIVDSEVTGNPDELSVDLLAEKARQCVESELARGAEEARRKVEALRASELVVEEVPRLLRAAHDGQVETLLLRRDGVIWGNYDEETRDPHYSATPDGGSVDLLNLAALQCYRQGGKVFVMSDDQMPHDTRPAVAVLRYAA